MTTKKTATKTVDKEIANLNIACNEKSCCVNVRGDSNILASALASLMVTENENNIFRKMMLLIIQSTDFGNKKKPAKKKAAPKKAITKKAAPKKTAKKMIE